MKHPFLVVLSGAALLASLGYVLVTAAARIARFVRARHRSELTTVIVQYEAPRVLSAAELGYIIDAEFGANELLATIAQLLSKGALSLSAASGDDFTITPKPVVKDFHPDDSESCVLGYLRSLPNTTTSWSDLTTGTAFFAGAQADFEDVTLRSLVDKGLLHQNALAYIIFRARIVSIVIAGVITGVCAVLAYRWGHHQVAVGLNGGFASIDQSVSIIAAVPVLIVAGVVVYCYVNILAHVYARGDGLPLGATPTLTALWPDVAGYQLYLRETEFVRLQTMADPFDPAMAYCLALGLDPGFSASLANRSAPNV